MDREAQNQQDDQDSLIKDWQYEVANGDTALGYAEWLQHRVDRLADQEKGPEDLTCLQAGADCAGAVEYRIPLSGTGQSFPRCEHHWELRLIEQDRIERTYPVNPPRDFDSLDAGERWDEED